MEKNNKRTSKKTNNSQTVRFRKPYGPKLAVTLNFPDPSLTKQSFKDECDINKIMARFQRTGVLDHVRKHQPEYGFASNADFTSSMQLVAQAQSMFEELPSSVRKRFDNSPGAFLDFVQDESNTAEMAELGLMGDDYQPSPPAEPPPAPPGPPEAPNDANAE